ncbi:VCBS domain-containing protein [Psychrobacter sp. NG27]|uniref:VCBS domain-containing protein n=1 Tax=Psychrobacter sp. NG27 TaxID=2781966 RepID=UPI002A18A337|nr:VCBS domain-containing protein [Psychrobacter sp. NG27]
MKIDNVPVTDVTVDITYTYTNSQTGDIETNTQTVTILAGATEASFTVDTIDDLLAETDENFTVTISNPQGGGLESIVIDDTAASVVTGITDGTPTAEDTVYAVITGDETVTEGDTADYSVSLKDNDGNPVIVTQDTDVTVTFNNGSTQDADTEYNNAQTITVTIPAGQSSAALNVDTIDDYLADDGENYSLTITSVGANEFEAVDFSDEATNTVTTTIDSNNAGDSANEGGLDSNDSVYVKLTGDDSQIEADDAVLTHTLSLVDADGQPVELPVGGSVVVNLSYLNDETTAADFDASSKLTTVTFNASTGNQIILTNTVLNDQLKEGVENYQLAISSVDGTNSGFESVKIDTQNSATGEIVDDVDLKPDVNTVQEDGVLTATGNVLTNDEIGTESSVSLQSQPSDANDYGALTLNNDGSYTYILDNDSSTVQALAQGEAIDQVFTYKVGEVTQILTITVTGTNDAPTLDVSGNSNTTVNYATAYQEGGVPVAISDSSAIADIDNNDTIGSALIVLTNSQIGDLIAIDEGALPAGIAATLLGNSRIELSGNASLADYQSAIDAITFANTSATPSEIDRIIEVTVTDINNADSNTTTTVISVDATPQAVDDIAQVTEGGKTISSNTTSLNLLTNDDLGTPNTTITSFTYLDENGISQTGVTGSAIDTQYGSLTINANGTWTYTSDDTSDNLNGIIDSISYTITDADGDTSTADFNITVDDTQPTALIPEVTLNEDDLTGGTDTTPDALRATRNLGITKAADDISDVVFTGVTTAGLEALALESNGEPLTYQVSNGGHTVVASSATGNSVFTITLTNPTDSTGDTQAFVFELQGQLDHTDGVTITLPVKYEIQDTDSATVQKFNVNIEDDKVLAKDDTPVSVVEGSYVDGDDSTLLTGNVIDNDKGADADLKINNFTYLDKDGNAVEDSTEFGVDLETPTGILTVNEDGSWTFAANKAIDNRDPAPNLQDDGSFSYTLIDADGDVSDAAEQSISVTDTVPIIESDESVILKEDELFPNSGTASTYVAKVESAFTVTGNEDNISDIYFTVADGTLINGRFQSSGLPLYYRYAEVDGVIDYSTLYVSTTQRGELIADTVDNPNNNVIFKVEINPEGLPYTSADALTYTATLYDTIKHDNIDADNDGRLDNIIFDLDYAVVDEDGSITEDQFDVEVENRAFDEDINFTINEGDFGDVTEDENVSPNGKDALLINAAENFDGGIVTILNYDLSSSIDLQSGDLIYIDVNGNARDANGLYTAENPAVVGSLRNIGNGQIEFNPEENYSSIATPNDRNVGTAEAPTGYEQTPDSFDPNYSVMFNLRAQVGGQTLTSKINIEVDPVADAPIIIIDDTEVDIVDGVYTNYVEEDSSTQLGFIAPIIGDNGVEASTDLSIYDPNYVNGTKRENDDDINGGSVDRSERFGAITLSGLPEGAQLFYIDGSGTQQIIIARTGDDGKVTIKLTDGTHIADSEFTADVEMTSAQFESLIVSHLEQDATNFTVTMSVTEYEVDENGVPYPLEPNDSSSADPDGSLIAETTSVDMLIDVQAVTDTTVIDLVEPVALPPGTTSITLSDDPNNGIDKNDTINAVIDEDSSLDLQSVLNETFVDTDGSERYWYSIEGLAELNGQVVMVNGTSYTVTNGTVTLPRARVTDDLDPSFIFTPPADFAGVIEATLTLNTLDRDADSANIAPAIQTEKTSVQLNITVNPTIDVTAVNPQTGAEDTAIALFTTNDAGDSVFTITDKDGSEEFSKIGISQSSLDASGGTVLDENNQIVDLTTLATETIDGDIYYIFGDNLSNVAGYTITPPAHSSADISLTYFVETTDGSVDSDNPITDNETFDVTIKVTPVAESADIDSDGDNSNDVTLNSGHTYDVPVFEDGDDDGVSSSAPVWYDLSTDAGFNLLNGWSNEDDSTDFGKPSHSAVSIDSEETFARLTVQIRAENGDWVNATGAQFRYDIAGETQTVTAGTNGVDVPVAGLSSLAFIPPNNYSGELRIQEQAVTIDYDEDDDTAIDKVVSGESFLYLTVTPVADDVLLSVQPAQGVEDAGRSNGNPTGIDGYTPDDTIDNPSGGIELKIKAQSKDTDGSETFNITINGIPDGASLYVWDTANGANGGYVLIDQNYGTVNDIATVDVDNADNIWSVTLTDYQNDKVPLFIPPLNSNEDYTLLVSGVSVDGADTSEPSTPLALPIKITTVADKILNDELNEVTFDYGGQTSESYAVILEESDLDAADNEIVFSTIFQTPMDIRSYDNDGSEVVTYVITGLDDRFTMQGADVTFIGGQGAARQWVVTDEAINNGEIILKTEDNFAGEINFNIKGVSTERTGGSEESQNNQPVQIFVKPDALDNDVVNPTAEQNENESVTLDFERAFRRTDNTDNWTSGVEELKSVAISLTDLDALGVQLTVGDVVITSSNPEVDAGFYTIERDSDGALPVTSIIAIAADPASAESKFVNHQSGNDVYQFGIKYTVTDTVRATNNETADIVYQTTSTRETDFVVDVLPITDEPSLVNLAEIKTSETIDIVNLDAADDEFIKTVTLTSPDLDGSEVFTRVQVDGVPDGILVQVDANGNGTFVEAIKAGDTWYVVFDDETINTSITASVDIKFSVKAGYDVDNAENVPITVTAYNQDAPDVEQSAQATFALTLITGMDGGVEEPPVLVADLIVKSITLTEDGAGQSLDNFITGTLNQVAYDNQTSAPISFTIANLPDDVVLESSNGVSLSKQGNTWLISGNVTSDSDIAELLSNISIIPTSDYSTNNQSEAVILDISFTATDSNGDSDSEAVTVDNQGTNDSTLIVLPITDYFEFHEDDPTVPENDDNIVIAEDETRTLTLELTKTADVGNVEVIDGSVYLRFTNNASINGTLEDSNGVPLATVTNPVGLPVGEYFVLPVGADNPASANFNFVPDANEDGATVIEAYVVHKETTDIPDHDTTTLVSRKDFEITVEKGPDPLLFVVNEAASNLTVDEDQGEIGADTDINVVSIVYDTVQTDEDDQPATFILNNVNDNFTVYYVNDGGDIVIANKTGTGSWSLPSTETNPTPEIFIQAPENYSGTSSAVISVLSTDGLQGDTTTVDLVFNPIADGVELTPQNSAGKAYTWVELNTNAKMEDTDGNGIDEGGSETLTLTITPEDDKPFDESMLFRIGDTGEVIGLRNADNDGDGVSVEFVGGSYVLSGVPSSSINDIQILYQAYNGTITYTGKTVETSDPEQVFSSEEIKTADLNLSESVAIETGEQNDTIITTNSSTTVNSGAGDDSITGGAGDDFLDGGTGVNTLIGGAGNDTLVFSADNTLMDGGDGIDTLLINVDNTTIDFGDFDSSVINNMEIIDMTGNGAQSLINLSTSDVIAMTDSNNELFINGDNGDNGNNGNNGDEVSLTADFVAQQVSDQADYTQYQSTIDPTVNLYIHSDITIL